MPKRLRPVPSGKVAACHLGSPSCRRSPCPTASPSSARSPSAPSIEPWVVYLAGRQEGWDQPREWFARREGYRSEVLTGWQRARAGRSPVTVARGLGAALGRIDPACVVSWEYGPATWRALAWCRRRRRPLLIFSELTPWSEAALSRLQLRVHRLLAPRAGRLHRRELAERRAARPAGRRPRPGGGGAPERGPRAAARARARRSAARGGRCACSWSGRLVPDKNLPLLLDAFAEAGCRQRGRARAAWQRAARGGAAGAGRPAWRARPGGRPRGSRPSCRPCTREADVLALVSTYEPFGVTMREGAAAGLPLLCSAARGRRRRRGGGRARTRCSWTRRAGPRSSPRCAGSCASRSCASGSPRAAARSRSAIR